MKSITYQPEIDGLRALAVLSVVFFHLKFSFFGGGFIGVDIFFVISGYLISSILFTEIKRNNFDFKKYLKKRLKRLLPALAFTAFISLCFSYLILSPFDLVNFSKSVLSSIFFVSNIFFWNQSNYFDQVSDFKPFLHTWSLGIEMSFYLIWPIFLIFLIKYFNKIAKIVFKIFFISCSLLFIHFILSKGLVFETTIFDNILHGKYISDTIFYLVPFRLFEFFFGSIIIFLPKIKFNYSIQVFFFVCGLFLIIISIFSLNSQTSFPSIFTIPVVLGTSLLIYFRETKNLNKILNNKIAIFFGLISYSLYLVHWPIISIFKYYNLGIINLNNKILIFIISILISFLMYKFIEKPFRGNYDFKKKFITLLSLSFVIIFSFSTILKDGFLWRLNTNQQVLNEKLNDESFYRYCDPKKSIFGQLKDKVCVVGYEENSEIILIGDSNGKMWFKPFEEFAKRNNKNFTFYSGICNNFPHQPKKSIIFENCSEIKTSAEVLIIGGQWFDYQTASKPNLVAKKIIANINKTKNINSFKSIKKIIIMGQIPAITNSNLDIISCFLRPKYLNKNLDCTTYYNISYQKNNFLNDIRKLNELMKIETNKILSKNYKVLFIDPVIDLCNNNSCKQIDKLDFYYRDNNHISDFGAKFVINLHMSEIEKLISTN
jgi:peptidoglycan/LPS O-acetylase OafA/YrhL